MNQAETLRNARRSAPRFDLAVIGGGFAGLSAAEEGARRGLSTLLVERRRRPGAPCSTTGLLPADALPAVRPPARLLGPGLRAVRLGHRGSASESDWALLVDRGLGLAPTDTPALLAVLAERAASEGAELRFSSGLRRVEREGDAFRLDLDDGVAWADALVAADGARSRVAACLGLPRPTRLLVGVEHHVEMPGTGALDPHAVSLVVDREWAPGYLAWAFRGVEDAWQVGLLGPASGDAPAAALASFRRWLVAAQGASLGRTIETRAGLVPASGPTAPDGAATRVRRAGDAAGHVSPLTAGGIGRAVESGRLVVRELVGDVTAPADRRALEARCGGTRSALRLAWQATRLPGGPRLAVAAARGALGARAAAAVLFGGLSAAGSAAGATPSGSSSRPRRTSPGRCRSEGERRAASAP